MVATILSEVSVGLTPEIEAALENAVAFAGIKSSQYVRIALVEKLCRENFLKHPGLVRLEKSMPKNPQQTEIKSAASV